MIESSAAGSTGPRVDIHVHLAGVGTQGSGCWTSPAFKRRPAFWGIRLLLGVNRRMMEESIDQDWAAMLSGLVARSDLDLAVVLGFDGVYDAQGRLDRERSQLVIPPEWVFQVCERYGNLAPAPSINPWRRDAIDALDASIEAGAVMIKWLPIVQAFDPGSRRTLPFLNRLADAGIPILVHAGTGEVTFRTIDGSVGDLDRLVPALEAGVKVVVAHTAAPILHSLEPNQLPILRLLLNRYPNLWVDNSGLANPSRFRHLPHFAADPQIHGRTLHGSDFPIPATSVLYPRRLGPAVIRRLEEQKNPLQKEVELKRAIGFDEAIFTRAASVLANLGRWYQPSSAEAA